MNELLMEEAKQHGDRLCIIPITRLTNLKDEITDFSNREELNAFTQNIIKNIYRFENPQTEFEIVSVIVIAVHHPIWADVELHYNGKIYHTRSLVRPDNELARKYLKAVVEKYGYHLKETSRLPMKRLAVQSGLAKYGRNNITYVDDLGSNVSYLAFFTDVPCQNDGWREVCCAEVCESCGLCIDLCPTGAIRESRFLIDNERCLAFVNERGGPFPDWLSSDVHHTLYDCLRCQENCPMNKQAQSRVIGPMSFTETEIQAILEGKGKDDFSQEFMDKANKIGLFDWSKGLARNVRAIMINADQN